MIRPRITVPTVNSFISTCSGTKGLWTSGVVAVDGGLVSWTKVSSRGSRDPAGAGEELGWRASGGWSGRIVWAQVREEQGREEHRRVPRGRELAKKARRIAVESARARSSWRSLRGRS